MLKIKTILKMIRKVILI